ncbi:vitamin K epoxide reductase family protein [Myxosarcina sp. GI1]|uniref:vitamin K epoxide reductase family protein n=1 Tax=Myxosarcina sp. GI1 TaxID=1541065 RepID=UPI0005614FE9|nr:vitamin K epoxide reductase family protein [Myxosarcina sp. GI1]
MRRRRSLPWIYRWSRSLIGAIAIAGAILTAYLTVTKLTGGEVACSFDAGASGGCSSVLDSPYAYVFGLPLSLFGCLAYLSMAVFALVPLAINGDRQKEAKKQLENITWWLLLAGSTSMAIFSGYLMYVLATQIQLVCFYCIGSALFSVSLLILTIVGRYWEDIGQILFMGIIVAVLTLMGTLAVYADVNNPEAAQVAQEEIVDADGLITVPVAQTNPTPPYGWEITTTSGESEMALAEHLNAIGAKEYGAFWCPHCYEQKQLLGKEAFEKINYVECDPQGINPQRDACIAAGVESFPTWEINGKLYPGTKTAAELAELSGYEGTMDFKYKLP